MRLLVGVVVACVVDYARGSAATPGGGGYNVNYSPAVSGQPLTSVSQMNANQMVLFAGSKVFGSLFVAVSTNG